MSPVPELIRSALTSVAAHDKDAARKALQATVGCLPSGPHPLRHRLRAVDCAVDISNWDLAWREGTAALETVDPDGAHELPPYPEALAS